MSEHWIDRAWKDLLKGDMDDAIAFFMPSLAAERDYTKMPEAADPVRNAIGGASDKDSNISDVCFNVPLKKGEFSRGLFLIEQQHDKAIGKNIPLRVFQSWYRASDEYQFPVTALAIYTGNAKPVNSYSRTWHGTSVNFMFNTYSVPEADAEKLKRDERPFAVPVLASKRMLDAGGSPLKREAYSLELLDMIKERGFEGERALRFHDFIRRILQIDKEDIAPKVKEVFKVQFKTQEEIRRELYIRSVAEHMKEEGKEEGKEEKAFEVARRMLDRNMSVSDIIDITGLGKEDILSLQ